MVWWQSAGEPGADMVEDEVMMVAPRTSQMESSGVPVEVSLRATGIAVVRYQVAMATSVILMPIPPMQTIQIQVPVATGDDDVEPWCHSVMQASLYHLRMREQLRMSGSDRRPRPRRRYEAAEHQQNREHGQPVPCKPHSGHNTRCTTMRSGPLVLDVGDGSRPRRWLSISRSPRNTVRGGSPAQSSLDQRRPPGAA